MRFHKHRDKFWCWRGPQEAPSQPAGGVPKWLHPIQLVGRIPRLIHLASPDSSISSDVPLVTETLTARWDQ